MSIATGTLRYLSISLFFFKQKTAYEMRISDWSSDVCSSDLFAMKTVLVTGATAGIGTACARAFVEAGWKVIATGRRAGRLNALVEELGADRVDRKSVV